jgi:endonuclease G
MTTPVPSFLIPSKKGYDAHFLGENFPVPLPEFSPELIASVLEKPELRDGFFADYVNFTVATNRTLRTPIYAALNIDQDQLKTVTRTNTWRIDSRIGADYQLNNDYYYSNPWDRGHLARKASAAWGRTGREAKHASDDTFFFSNASLQHANFNQDEWLALEDWVKDLDIDSTNRINSISGPIFGSHPRSITPAGRETALIPSAFFKIVSFVNQPKNLEVLAFIMPQDAEALADRKGRRMFDNQRYQVSITEIEERTGLIFPSILPDTNPLYFNTNPEAAARLNISHFPERIEVDAPSHLIEKTNEKRDYFLDDKIAVYIAAALVNPSGLEKDKEWISIINLSAKQQSLDGWTVSDTKRSSRKTLSGILEPGEAKQVRNLAPLQLGNKGGAIALYNEKNQRIDRVKYSEQDAILENKPVIFAFRKPELAI